ncbi:unnamed protein product [Cuscuta epithymum]|uniref:Pentatricopeptide repeat-containing protein n=1 Tax=Cuscuta epithymum TaxID=186058 RepID=A0AAV0FGJ9_9ASTE|nr:unnamed protein product [Cuscuta epithymum]
MLQLTIPKSRFPLSTIFCRPAISAAALVVSSEEPSISTPYPITPSQSSPARNEAARKLLFLFSGLSAKGLTVEKLCHDPRFGGLLSRVNASEVESIVELLRLKRPHLAVDFFFLAKELGFKHSVCCQLIVAHVLAGKRQLREMRSLLEEMVNEEGSGSAYSLCELLQNNFENWVSCNVVWNMLAFSYLRSDMVVDCLCVLSKMKDLNVEVSIRTYNNLLYNLRHSNSLWHVYNEIKDSEASPSEYTKAVRRFFDELTQNGLIDDIVLWLIHRYVKCGDVREVGQLCRLLLERGIALNTMTFNSLIYGFCKVKKLVEARKLIDEIYARGLMPTVQTFTTLMNAYVEEGDIKAMLDLLSEMEEIGIEPNCVTRTVILKSFCNYGRLQEAVQILKDTFGKGLSPDEVAFNTVIRGFAQAGDMRIAFCLYNELLRNSNSQPNHITYNILITGLCIFLDIRVVDTFFTFLQDQNVCLSKQAYTTLVKAHSAKGDAKRAIDLFEQMIDTGYEVSIRDYTAVINRLCKRHLIQGMLYFFGMMLSSGITVDKRIHLVMLRALRRRNDYKSWDQFHCLVDKYGLDLG